MINIRYHIVSIAAVFLALGIGTALGSTFLDRYTVNVLDTNIRSAETRIKAANEENRRLNGQVDKAEARDKSLIQAAGLVSLSADLTDVPVLVVTAAGVDQTTVDGVLNTLGRSGADLRGTLELRSTMRLDQDVDNRVVDALSTTPSSRRATRTAVYRALRAALLSSGQPDQTGTGTPSFPPPSIPGDATPTTVSSTPAPTSAPVPPTPDQTTTTTGAGTGKGPITLPDGTQPAIITGLIDADYLRFAPGPGHQAGEPILESAGYRFVFVSAPGLDTDDDRAMIDLLPAGANGTALPAVVVSASMPDVVDANAPAVTPSAVNDVRDSQRLTGLYSTVDNAETFSGLVAMVVALDRAGTNAVGHYGQGRGASSILPPAP